MLAQLSVGSSYSPCFPVKRCAQLEPSIISLSISERSSRKIPGSHDIFEHSIGWATVLIRVPTPARTTIDGSVSRLSSVNAFHEKTSRSLVSSLSFHFTRSFSFLSRSRHCRHPSIARAVWAFSLTAGAAAWLATSVPSRDGSRARRLTQPPELGAFFTFPGIFCFSYAAAKIVEVRLFRSGSYATRVTQTMQQYGQLASHAIMALYSCCSFRSAGLSPQCHRSQSTTNAPVLCPLHHA
jgi:hypothetical protein